MRTCTFYARNAQEAVTKIREALGPAAVVLQVRKVRAQGIAGLLGRTCMEVVAALPETEPSEQTREVLDQLRRELSELRGLVERQQNAPTPRAEAEVDENHCPPEPGELTAFFIRLGLLPQYARQLAASARLSDARQERVNRRETAAVLRSVLQQVWRDPPPLDPQCLQIVIGAPGVGKSTVLCKWLARLVLRDNQRARVWYADGERPNLSETLRLHAELLGVPEKRMVWDQSFPERECAGEWNFLDLPGLNWKNRAALEAMLQKAEAWGAAQWHLVISAAYDTQLLLEQVRAFSVLPLAGVIVTHVDEAPALGKLWNIPCGTNCSVRFLSGGQNIPGEFNLATPSALGPAVLWAETAISGRDRELDGAGKASAMKAVADL